MCIYIYLYIQCVYIYIFTYIYIHMYVYQVYIQYTYIYIHIEIAWSLKLGFPLQPESVLNASKACGTYIFISIRGLSIITTFFGLSEPIWDM